MIGIVQARRKGTRERIADLSREETIKPICRQRSSLTPFCRTTWSVAWSKLSAWRLVASRWVPDSSK
jgi:hypothetical protein